MDQASTDLAGCEPGRVIRLDEFGGILQRTIDVSFNSETVRNGFRVCGLFPFDENAVDYSKCIAGKANPEPTGPRESEATIAVSQNFLEGIIQQISSAQAALYRELDLDFFTGESEIIVCQLYKAVLQPLDQRVLHDKSSKRGQSHDEEDLRCEQLYDDSLSNNAIQDFSEHIECYSIELNEKRENLGQINEKANGDCDQILSNDSFSEEDILIGHCEDAIEHSSPDVESHTSQDVNLNDSKESRSHVSVDLGNFTSLDDMLEVVSCDDPETSRKEIDTLENDPLSISNCSDPETTIKSYLNEPDTPKKKNKKFNKAKSPPVLTSRKLLELHRKKEEDKENSKREKIRKSEKKHEQRTKRAREKKIEMIRKTTERLERLKHGLQKIDTNKNQATCTAGTA
ncbi:uncharacterized protein LOC129734033 [Wyeomyia smithii]|uniref:uncharacterized protein LOC129734033 n=1 Tax=Wyeomyia smithii TaxID=174621 RepID=UPI002467B7BE|nr:uncharacterized protein LOC129734033 [Wyeomyia smithii]